MAQDTLGQAAGTANLPPWTFKHLMLAGAVGGGWLKGRLGRLPPGCRWRQYSALLGSVPDNICDATSQALYQDSIRSSIDIFLASLAFQDSEPIPRDTLIRLLKGAPGKHLAVHSTPWDTQFELFCFSLLRLAGLKDVRLAEPDLLVPAGVEHVGFAVKRVTTSDRDRIVERFRAVLNQLYSNGVRGMILLDLPHTSLGPDALKSLELVLADVLEAVDTDHRAIGFMLVGAQWNWPGPNDSDGLVELSIGPRVYLRDSSPTEVAPLLAWLKARGEALNTALNEGKAALTRIERGLTTA